MVHFLDRKLSWVCLLFTLPLLFLPKINIAAVGERETAGLRIDDLFLLVFGFVFLCAHIRAKEPLQRIEKVLLVLVALSLVSYLLNQLFVAIGLLFLEANLFYVIRPLEYFIFFYVGAILPSTLLRGVLLFFLWWNVFWMALQKLSLLGGVAYSGYIVDVSGRVQGIASFPSEMGLILNLLYCYFAFDAPFQVRVCSLLKSPYFRAIAYQCYNALLFCFFAALVIATGNRISLAALLLTFIVKLVHELRRKAFGARLSLAILIPIVIASAVYIAVQTASIYERSKDLFSWKNVSLVANVWEAIDIDKGLPNMDTDGVKWVDLSWWIRIHKWLFITKSYVDNPECYLCGLGPGVAGAAMDGGVLRILCEGGLLGAMLYWKFFSTLAKTNTQTKWMVIAFACNMLFFDAYLAYKAMSLLLFTCGALQQHLARGKLEREQLRDPLFLHGDAKEGVAKGHRPFIVCDDEELTAAGKMPDYS